MSIPPSIELPSGVEPLQLFLPQGELAALRTTSASHADFLLVPGFTGSKEDFLPLLPLLAEMGWSVLAVDQRGQYESPGPQEEHHYSLAKWAAELCEVAKQVDGVHLVGHSFGGLVCREAALSHPDLFHSLTLLDSGPAALPQRHHNLLALLMSVIPEMSMQEIWKVKEQLDRNDGVDPPPEEIHRFLEKRWIAGSPGALCAMAHILTVCPDRTEELASLVSTRLSCLVAFGEEDDTSWTPDEMTDMAWRLGQPPVVIPGAGHSPAVETPDILAGLLTGFAHRAKPQ